MNHWVEIDMSNCNEGCFVNGACVFFEIINLVACQKFHGCGCVADFSPRGRRTMHQQAGTGIWHRDTSKKVQKQHHKKVAGKQHNRNWQGSRRNDVEAVNQVFGAHMR
jgi:hypothetical protein